MNQISKQSSIAIVGAGIAGLSLAISLHLKNFHNIKVFEKDQKFQSRSQGYGLTILQAKTALKELGVFEKLKQYNVPNKIHYTFDFQGKILGLYGTILWDHKNNNKSIRLKQKGLSMHVPRQALRKVLMQRYLQLKADKPDYKAIKWSSKLKDIKFGSKIQIQLDDGMKHECDYLFGCDGIYSQVRKLSTANQQQLIALNIMIVLGLCNSSHPLTDQTIFQTRNGKYRFYSMPFQPFDSQLNTMWQLSFKMQHQSALQYKKYPEKVKQMILNDLKNWHQPIPSMINDTSLNNFMCIAGFDRGTDPPVMKDRRIVLIGDSLHPMSPFKSQGANQALLNSIHVANLFQKSQSFTEIDVNKLLMERTSNKVLLSRQRIQSYHSEDYVNIDNYLYDRIDSKLIETLRERKLNANSQNLEKNIIQIVKQLNY